MKVTGSIQSTNYTTSISYKNHTIVADEPNSLGGSDAGMNPIALLGSSLASCTCITIKMYAERKGWNLDEVKATVHIKHDLKVASIDFHKEIAIIGAITQDEKERLHKIASSCPVNKLLSKSSTITSELL